MLKLIKKYYSEGNAEAYDSKRKKNPKWKFEDQTLKNVLAERKESIKKVVDYPVGTGRAFDELLKYQDLEVVGVDFSLDMIEVAKEKDKNQRVKFFQQDIFNPTRHFLADLVISYRFLNLFHWELASQALINLMSYSNKYILFSIRTISDEYKGPEKIEDKIFLHRNVEVKGLIRQSGFVVEKEFSFPDEREGDYKILLCQREKRILSSRFSKSGRYVYTYGGSLTLGKMYEVENNDHAKFIKSICGNKAVRQCFPSIRNISRNYVDVEWVKGELLPKSNWSQILGILLSIQDMKNTTESSFDYVEDKVMPRFLQAAPLIGLEFSESVVDIVVRNSERFEKKVSHPDLVPGNVLETANGIVLIDNELLCFSKYYWIDILNMLHNLPPEDREEIALAYLEKKEIGRDELLFEKEYLSALWLTRQVGSNLYYGKIEEILEMKVAYLNGENILPFDFFS